MRRFLSYLLAALVLLAACAREDDVVESTWDGPVIALTLNVLEDIPTKAGEEEESSANPPYDQPGENAYHENDIKWVDFYFYPDGATSSNATYHRREVLSKLTRNSATFRLELTTDVVNTRIFPANIGTGVTRTVVLALVNVDKDLLDAQDNTSMTALKNLLITTDFEATTQIENHRQQSFMMSGETTIKLKGRTRKEVIEDDGSTIQLERYACKITVGVKTRDKMEIQLFNSDNTPKLDENNLPIFEVWTPCLEEMKIYLEDGIKTVSLGGSPVDVSTGIPDGYESLSYRGNPMLFFRDEGEPGAPEYYQIFDTSNGYYNTYPTYTYPQHWKNGNEGEPYLKLVLPWERAAYPQNEISYAKKEFYYKILIPNDVRDEYVRTFIRNNWYHYNIEVGMLGADTDDTQVEIRPIDCYVYYWQDKNVVVKRADIGNARYLSVGQTTVTINNEETCKINYTSSHPVHYQVNSAIRPYYGAVDSPDPSVTSKHEGDIVGDGVITKASDGTYYLDYDASGWFSQVGNSLVMTHQLDNSYKSATFDYAPYTISVTIWHADQDLSKTDYQETITIIQNPAIYIVEEPNSDPRLPGAIPDDIENAETKTNPAGYGKAVWPNYAHAGYVFEDGARLMRHRSGKKDDGEYGTVAKHLNSSWKNNTGTVGDVRNKLEWLQWRTVNFTGGNRSRYTIHVSVLANDSPFIIGDPRTRQPETWNNGLETVSTVDGSPNYCYWYKGSDKFHYWDWEHYFDGYANPYDSSAPVVPFERDTDDTEFTITFRKARAINDKNGPERELTNYYPAEGGDRTLNMLAPGLRVASRFGGVEFYDGITKRSAEFKCATYQEDGYPAGRWRLPTKAEIDFIATLTREGGFVKLFGDSQYYWSAHGPVQPQSGLKPTRTYSLVRCVYDAWFWDPFNDRLPEAERDTYYFGDFER